MKNKLLFSVFYLASIIVFAQTSSNTCTDALNAPQHIDGPGTYSVVSFDGTAPTPVCTSNGVATNGEWFMYTPSSDFLVTISSDIAGNSGSDTRLHIYNGNCGTLNCIASSDDISGATYSSRLSVASFTALAGQTYYIAWDNYWLSFGGDLGFSFELTEEVSAPISFSQQNLNTGGTFRAIVDMNNDFIDDIVSVVARNISTDPNPLNAIYVYDINIQQQQVNGSFTNNDYIVSAPYSASWSLAAGDINNDGYNDLVFGNGSGVNIIRAENNGASYTVDTATSGVFTQRTNFVDINNDGHLDVFVCHDVAPNVYFINDESNTLTFHQGADLNGVPEGLGVLAGNYGTIWIDYDNDGDIDMFNAKCGGSIERRTNQLFRNNGNSSFTEVGVASGLADPIQTWSAAWGDYDNDGDMDCFVGGYNGASHKMMRNNNDGTFTDVTTSTGIDAFVYTGIDNFTVDFNNDGYIDIFSNGHVLLNDGNANMSFTAYSSGMPPHGSIGDLNNDGFIDVFSSSKIYYNDGNTNNWIKINTVGVQSNKNGIGARVEVSSPSFTVPQIRDVRSGVGFRYMNSLTSHFGLGSDTTINSITVYWPSGAVDIVNNPSINQSITIVEGTTLSLQSTLAEDLILYPNPTKRLLFLNTTYNFENAVYTIFDVSGKRVLNSKFSSNIIDVSSLSTGNYFLRIMDNGLIRTQKFIKD